MNLSQLQQIGLTNGEIRIYKALLELGETTRTQLAKQSSVSPSKIYDVTNRMLEKGIISRTKKNGVFHFAPANPRKLQEYIIKKEEKLEEEKELIELLLPQLLAKYQTNKEDTDVEVFYGREGMKTVYFDLVDEMEKGDCNYIFGAGSGYDSEQLDRFFTQYYKKKKKKGFRTKIIFNEEIRTNKTRLAPLTKHPDEVRFLEQKTFAEINTYKDTVLFVLLLKTPIIIRIKNKEAAESFKTFFDTLWKQAKVL